MALTPPNEARGLQMRRSMWMPHHATYEPRLTNYPLSESIVISGASKSGWAHFHCVVCDRKTEQEGSSLSRHDLASEEAKTDT